MQYCVVPILGTLFLKTLLDTCSSGPCLGTCSLGALLGNLFLGAKGGLKFVYRNLVWESVLAELASKPCFQLFVTCLGTLFGFGTLLGILFLHPKLLAAVLRNFAWEIILGKLFLGT